LVWYEKWMLTLSRVAFRRLSHGRGIGFGRLKSANWESGSGPTRQFCYCFSMGDTVRIQVCGFEIDDSNYNILVALMVEPTSII
jgi:hypothetical protein